MRAIAVALLLVGALCLAALAAAPDQRALAKSLPIARTATFKCPRERNGASFPCAAQWCCNSTRLKTPVCCGREGACCNSVAFGDFCCPRGLDCTPWGCM
jgi:hypothetical protein